MNIVLLENAKPTQEFDPPNKIKSATDDNRKPLKKKIKDF